MTKQKQNLLLIFLLLFSLIGSNMSLKAQAATLRHIVFPVVGNSYYSNDYNAPRDGGASIHHAIDIIANKRQPLVSAIAGTITDVEYPQPSWGYSVTIEDADGYKYRYIHMNDDNPGTNDGKGGAMNAYAADVKEGNRVVRGQLIGRVGDSGHANGIAHLHFEMFGPDDKVMNPFTSLNGATRISAPKNYPALTNEILPNGMSFKSRISLDMGNFDSDPVPEIVTGAGPGGSYVKVFETDGTLKARFAPNKTSFKGGIDVAAGDVDNDGTDEIITGAGPGGSYVKVFETDGTLKTRFAPYGTNFKGGLFVSSGDVDNDGTDEIITGAGPGGGPHVAIWEPDATPIGDFYPYSKDFRGGVRVSAGDIRTTNPKDEIITVPASKGAPIIRMFNETGSLIGSYFFMEEWWKGYHDVAATEGISMAATGVNRRDSLREGIE